MLDNCYIIRRQVPQLPLQYSGRMSAAFFMPGSLSSFRAFFISQTRQSFAARTYHIRLEQAERAGCVIMETWLIITLIAMLFIITLMAKL